MFTIPSDTLLTSEFANIPMEGQHWIPMIDGNDKLACSYTTQGKGYSTV